MLQSVNALLAIKLTEATWKSQPVDCFLEKTRAGMFKDNLSVTAASSSLDTPYHDLSSHQNYSDDSEYNSALWPTPGQTSPANPTPCQPLPPRQDPYSDRDGSVHTGTPVPLYTVPATHFSVTSGASGGDSSVTVMGAPGGRAGEEMLWTHPALGETRQPGWLPWRVES